MELPSRDTEKAFKLETNLLSAELQTHVQNDDFESNSYQLQEKLDAIAAKYQHDESLGSSRFKLYEIQAQLHYLRGETDSALSFINTAVRVHGSSFAAADELLSKLGHAPSESTSNGSVIEDNKLVGVKGWLAVFLAGLVITFVLQAINFSEYITLFNDMPIIEESFPEFAAALQPVLWIELFANILLVALATATFILILKRKKLGKDLAIVFAVVSLLLGIADYLAVDNIASRFTELELGSSVDETGTAMGRSIIYALIWIPYFMISKRVKATLTR